MKVAPKIHIINVVWGNDFIHHFLNISLPGLLSEGNLKYLKKNSISSVYKLYTLDEDIEKINNSSVFQELKEILPVEMKSIKKDSDYFKMMTYGHNQSIQEAIAENAALIFLSPDCVIADGMIKYVINSMQRGIRVISLPSIRLNKETFVKNFKNFKNKILSSRELVSIALKNLHPLSKNLFLKKKFINTWPSHLYYQIDKNNLLLKGFHTHPLFIYPQTSNNILPSSSIDDDFIEKSCPDKSLWELIDDSDKITVCEFTTSDISKYLHHKRKSSIFYLIWWIKYYTNNSHKFFVKKTHYFHSTDKISNYPYHLKKFNKFVNSLLFWTNSTVLITLIKALYKLLL